MKDLHQDFIPPLHCRKLTADMALKHLSQKKIAAQTGLNKTLVSALLNGRRVNPAELARIRKAVERAPMPRETAAA